MTLNISVVGKFHEHSNDVCDKTGSPLYEMDASDPTILPVDAPHEVKCLIYYYIFFYIFMWHASMNDADGTKASLAYKSFAVPR